MTFLLAYSPLCSLSRESHAVRRHPSPRAVDESPDYLDRTGVEHILSHIFGFFERVLVDLTIPILSPSPILELIANKLVYLSNKHNELTISIGLSSQ
jgi:hypothetical protein